jgi:short-subunit dehydrogenase
MKFTLITGASGGIGEAFARRLAEEKHNLVLVARSGEKLLQLCDELMLKHQITAHYVALDLTEFEADKKLFEETTRHGYEIDWLINNAGFGSMGDFAELDLERELEMVNLNIMALVALTHRYLEKMRQRKSGVIINVSSTASFQAIPFMATYAATKAFVTSFSEAVAEENRPFNITVTAVCPGPTKTNFFAASGAVPFSAKGVQTPQAVVEKALKAVRAGKPLVISGITNYIGAVLGTIAPDSLVTRVVGNVLRPKLKEKKK